MTLSTCSFLFSGVLTEIVQQIHSLRESDVRSSQAARALGSDDKAFRKSVGSSCATPLEIFLLMNSLYQSRGSRVCPIQKSSGGPARRLIGYLSRLKARMLKVGFTQDDLLYQRVSQSYYAIQALSMQLHYLSCKSGVFRPSE